MGSRQTDIPFDLGVRAFRSRAGRPAADDPERHDAVIVGGGQAGLATGYHLARRGMDVLILDENERVGDGWRAAWDSLRLFTPARYDGLPGMPFPGDPNAFPTRDEMAAYLHAYAERFRLPVRSGVAVDGLRRADGGGWSVTAGERRFEAPNVVVATGPHRLPSVPDVAAAIDPAIRQLHSSEYRNPGQLAPGPVLVVGAAHSGPDIALEAAAEHRTTLVGPYRGEIPFAIEGRAARVLVPVLWQVANHVLTVGTPAGRRVRPEVRAHGGPLIRVRARDLERAGVVHLPAKVVGARDGLPLLADGRVVEASTVVWCTGFRLDFGWIDPPIVGDDGYPRESRGVVPSAPGLYVVGLPFQRTFASMLIGGVGSDAAYVAAQIAARASAAA
ncbi:MAG: FAD-dependent oxidoreductase [Thermoleophilia bacterium]